MKSIAILTATRAEYGLLSPIIKALIQTGEYDIRVLVTGAHLSEKYGMTYKEIELDGIHIDAKIPILSEGDAPVDISRTMGNAMIGFGEYFSKGANRPDALMVLGDRYETLAVCCTAMNERIPIIHLYGGETTEGAIDEAIRHAITKLSYLHLTSTDEYRRRVIQLGESPDRVYTVGAIGVENALKVELLNREELAQSIDFDLGEKFAMVTFHPVTLENASAKKQCEELLAALDKCENLRFVITKANADTNGQIINEMLETYAKNRENVCLVDSLGVKRYLSALNEAVMVIGNSSSGLIEAPSFHIATVNIGDRQKGRLKAKSVIDCEPLCDDILNAIKKAGNMDCGEVINPYGDGNTTNKIINMINQKIVKQKIEIKKEFYDLEAI